jgi:hypothetical protein
MDAEGADLPRLETFLAGLDAVGTDHEPAVLLISALARPGARPARVRAPRSAKDRPSRRG